MAISLAILQPLPFLPIVSLYAAVLAFFYVFLSLNVIRTRRRNKIAVGDGDKENLLLQRAIRAHANFAEYTPFALLLLYFVEVAVDVAGVIHILGLMLCAGRAIHAFGITKVKENYRFRILGMALTFGVIGGAAVLLLGKWFLS